MFWKATLTSCARSAAKVITNGNEDSAVLAALDSSTTPPPDSTDAIRYNLSVDLSFNNSHPQVEIQYLSVAVAAFYGDFMLGLPDRTFPTPFSQGPSNTTVRASEFTSPSNS